MIPRERLRELLAAHDRAQGAAVLRAAADRRVTRVPFDEASDAVCKERVTLRWRTRLGVALRGSRAARSLAGARALRAAGFRVPEPLGVVEERGRSVYVARHVPGPTLAEALARADADTARRLARATASLLARLHEAGFCLRDVKPPNLVVAEGEGGALVPVDLDDVRRRRRVPRDLVLRNLASLDAYAQAGPRPLGAGARWRALEEYSRLRGLSPGTLWREVLRLGRAKRRRWARQGPNPRKA